MEIVWLGHSCFRIRGREATIVTDPCPPASGYTIGKPTADIVTISHRHDDHSFVKAVAGSPTVLDGPGEYEVSGAFVTGIATHHDDQKGQERGSNLVFIIEMEEIKVCHLGDLGHTPTAGPDVSKGDLEGPDRFLKEMGATPHEPQPKVSVTKNSLPADTQVMILDYRR
jgi:L-ascorbate metabolism protein UlaG (beta-lactamase superfamily)